MFKLSAWSNIVYILYILGLITIHQSQHESSANHLGQKYRHITNTNKESPANARITGNTVSTIHFYYNFVIIYNLHTFSSFWLTNNSFYEHKTTTT